MPRVKKEKEVIQTFFDFNDVDNFQIIQARQ